MKAGGTRLGGQFGEEQLTTIRSRSTFSKDQLPMLESANTHTVTVRDAAPSHAKANANAKANTTEEEFKNISRDIMQKAKLQPNACLKYSVFLTSHCYNHLFKVERGSIRKLSRAARGPRAVACQRLTVSERGDTSCHHVHHEKILRDGQKKT